ncbi:Uncharacterized protein Rs2_02703 [Raphanus sativus]|nr:Uncharacterized protein Rs2_02703 [Raphanus sativus]
MSLDDWKPAEYYFYDFIDLSENEISGSPARFLNQTEYLVEFRAAGNKLRFDMGKLTFCEDAENAGSVEKLGVREGAGHRCWTADTERESESPLRKASDNKSFQPVRLLGTTVFAVLHFLLAKFSGRKAPLVW